MEKKNVCRAINKKRLNGKLYKNLFKSWTRVPQVPDVSPREGDGKFGESNCCFKTDVVNRSFSPLKKHRVDCNSEKKFYSDNATAPNHKPNSDSHSKDAKDFNNHRRQELEEPKRKEKQTSCQLYKKPGEGYACSVCALGGDLLHCDGRGCKRRLHLYCVDPPFTFVPPGVWHCIWCVQKKIQFGIYSVSEGQEYAVDDRESDLEHEVQKQKEYLVKYRGLAHVHNRWIPERELKERAKSLFAQNRPQFHGVMWNTEWALPHRLLQKRQICLPKDCDSALHDCQNEWLVKWTDLGYDRATWELETASFLKSPEAARLIRDFESRHKNEGKTPSNRVVESAYINPTGVHSQHEKYIDKLRKYWFKRQSSVVFENEERFGKLVLFILSLKDNNLPFLIVAPFRLISAWEAEFSRHESSNMVVYMGNSNVRSSIRSLEFRNEYGCIMFQVLLSTPSVVIEDLTMLVGINWGGVIVDDCQRPVMYYSLNQFKDLMTDMRLLIANNHIMDKKYVYNQLLSFISSGNGEKENASDSDDSDPDDGVSKLKEKLSCLTAYDCKHQASGFSEYWVPVMLSNVQLEQYCASLISKSMFLCSSLRNGLSNSLHGLLVSERECCDHPYLVDLDHSLRRSLTKDLLMAERLEAEIEMSGKLKLLDKCLLHIKEQGLRVLIVFQPCASPGRISVGDVLDDFVLQRFGKDSYVRIVGEHIASSKRQAVMKSFNNKEGSQFVVLLEQRACLPSIKLSSVDTVILFDSDWDPLNDTKALQKNSFRSQSQPLKVFRLYSVHTVEEMVLILAKQGPAPDTLKNTSRKTCNKLLTWGALHLFDKLDQFHVLNDSNQSPCLSNDRCFLNNVISEFSALLSSNRENTNLGTKIISKVEQIGQAYLKNVSLYGEVEAESGSSISSLQRLIQNESSSVYWTNVLNGRSPTWKFLSNSSQVKEEDRNKLPEETQSTEKHPRRIEGKRKNDFTQWNPEMKRKTRGYANEKSNSSSDGLAHPARKKSNTLQNVHDENAASISKIGCSSKKNKADCISRKRVRKRRPLLGKKSQFGKAVTSIVRDLPASELITTRLNPNQTHIVSAQGSKRQLPQVSKYQSLEDSTAPDDFDNSSTFLPLVPAQIDRCLDIATSLNTSGSFLSSQNMETLRACTTQLTQANDTPLEVPCSTLLDPQERDLEIMQKVIEQALKIKQNTKVQLRTEFEKEIDQVTKKYLKLLEDVEMELPQKANELETYYKKVNESKSLVLDSFTNLDSAEAEKSSKTRQGTKRSDQRRKQSIAGSLSTTSNMSKGVSKPTVSLSVSLSSHSPHVLYHAVPTDTAELSSAHPQRKIMGPVSEIRSPAPHFRCPRRPAEVSPLNFMQTQNKKVISSESVGETTTVSSLSTSELLSQL